MKKMIPVYLIQLIILGAVITVGVLLLRKAEAIKTELVGIRSEQVKQTTSDRPLRGGPALRVEVVNTPSVDISGSVDCNINEPLDCNINEPLDVTIKNEPLEVDVVQ